MSNQEMLVGVTRLEIGPGKNTSENVIILSTRPKLGVVQSTSSRHCLHKGQEARFFLFLALQLKILTVGGKQILIPSLTRVHTYNILLFIISLCRE